MIIDVFEQSWVCLASWFPPRHFRNSVPGRALSSASTSFFVAPTQTLMAGITPKAKPGHDVEIDRKQSD
jgi:hypothetical protein